MSLLIELLTFIVTAAGLFGLFYQIRAAAHAQRDEFLRQQRQNTLTFYADSFEQRSNIWDGLPDDRDRAAIALLVDAIIADDSDERFLLVRRHLNYYESMAVGVRLGVYDLKTISELCGGRVVSAYTNYQPLILERRRKMNEASIWESFTWLATRLLAEPSMSVTT